MNEWKCFNSQQPKFLREADFKETGIQVTFPFTLTLQTKAPHSVYLPLKIRYEWLSLTGLIYTLSVHIARLVVFVNPYLCHFVALYGRRCYSGGMLWTRERLQTWGQSIPWGLRGGADTWRRRRWLRANMVPEVWSESQKHPLHWGRRGGGPRGEWRVWGSKETWLSNGGECRTHTRTDEADSGYWARPLG